MLHINSIKFTLQEKDDKQCNEKTGALRLSATCEIKTLRRESLRFSYLQARDSSLRFHFQLAVEGKSSPCQVLGSGRCPQNNIIVPISQLPSVERRFHSHSQFTQTANTCCLPASLPLQLQLEWCSWARFSLARATRMPAVQARKIFN